MEGHAPLYVKVSEYDEVLAILDNVKKKVTEARDVIRRLNELKAEEDRELAAWNASLDEITHRIESIDKSLSQ
jgi:hypothetical protein